MTNNLEKYYNKHQGQRCFIVGNGPSLNDTNLDLLKNEVTFGMNRIDLIYPKTIWRPTYYIFSSSNCTDHRWGNGWSKSVVNCCKEPSTIPFIWDRYKNDIENRAGKLDSSTHFLTSFTEFDKPMGTDKHFSTDANLRLDKSGTTLNIALQLAYYMGFKDVYVIGADMNWVATDSSQGDPNHFDPSYKASIANGQFEFDRMSQVHAVAKKFFDKRGGSIYNAGYNSALKIHPKVDFESLF